MIPTGLLLWLLGAAASPLSGVWESAGYRAELAVRGTAVSGEFTCHLTDPPAKGTITGMVADGGQAVQATWTYEVGGEPVVFQTHLRLAAEGRILEGFAWGWAGDDRPSAFGLRRGQAGRRGEFLDETTADGADPPPTPDRPTPPTPERPTPPTPERPTPPSGDRPAPSGPALEPPREAVQLFANSDPGGVRSPPTAQTRFTLDRPHRIVMVRTYHWNGGRGQPPGSIGLEAADGTRLGLWRAAARPPDAQGRGNIIWIATPDLVLPAGQYRVTDSHPATWSCSDKSGGAGFAWVWGIPEGAPAPVGEPVTILDNSNPGAVEGSPTVATTFTLARPHRITLVRTYHWHGGEGVPPGTIALRAADGTTYGPWHAVGQGSSGGRKNLMWVVEPMLDLPAGTYTIIDSDPATWSQNAASRRMGIAWVSGVPR